MPEYYNTDLISIDVLFLRSLSLFVIPLLIDIIDRLEDIEETENKEGAGSEGIGCGIMPLFAS